MTKYYCLDCLKWIHEESIREHSIANPTHFMEIYPDDYESEYPYTIWLD